MAMLSNFGGNVIVGAVLIIPFVDKTKKAISDNFSNVYILEYNQKDKCFVDFTKFLKWILSLK